MKAIFNFKSVFELGIEDEQYYTKIRSNFNQASISEKSSGTAWQISVPFDKSAAVKEKELNLSMIDYISEIAGS